MLTYRIFFSLSKSSRSLVSTTLEVAWEALLVFQSRWRLRNHSGILKAFGLDTMAMTSSSFSCVSSPALWDYIFGASRGKGQVVRYILVIYMASDEWLRTARAMPTIYMKLIPSLPLESSMTSITKLLATYLPLSDIDFSLLTYYIWKTTSHTLDWGQGILYRSCTIYVSVQDTQDVLKLGSNDERLLLDREKGGMRLICWTRKNHHHHHRCLQPKTTSQAFPMPTSTS